MTEKTHHSAASSVGNDEIDVGRLIGTVVEARWWVLGITGLFAAAAIVYCLFATPIYSADALVQIEQNAGNSLVQDIGSALTNKPPASEAEIQLIQSRLVLGKTVDDLNLDIAVTKNTFPVFGAGWDRLMGRQNDTVKVTTFTLPKGMNDQVFTLKVLGPKQYSLTSDGGFSARGEVGQPLSKDGVTMLVSAIQAANDSEFTVTKFSTLGMINNLQNNLSVTENGKDTGVLSLTYIGEDRDQIRDILNSITRNYLQQNVERKSEEAAKSLEFLNKQLPEVRAKLDVAENKLNTYRQQQDSVDLPLEAKSVLDSMVNIDAQLNELTFKEAEISKLYTKAHPAYRTLLEKRKALEDEKAKLNTRVTAMPKTQQEIVRLTRDVESGQQVYMQLLNKQQELRITEASTVGDVRIVDAAITQPGVLKPKKALIILGSIILGLILSVVVVLLRSLFNRGIESPQALEEQGISVYASIPLSEWQKARDTVKTVKGNKRYKQRQLLAVGNPADLAIEAVRSLRTSLHFAMMQAPNNVLMMTGVSPSIGKTFVCANLAAVISQTNKRVLMIDCDMRKGYTHELLGTDNVNGLSDILVGKGNIESCAKKTSIANFDLVPRGQIPPNPSELLMSERFTQLLDWASKHYDLVLIDTPPILAVTDAAIVGRHAGTTLMVARYAVNTVKEVQTSLSRFEQNGIQVKGVILNSIFRRATGYQDYGYYEYEYKSDSK
ncbi:MULTISPECIES: tyrosine-protein kinase Wzc [Enterobacteriaceae]|jgi:tyrosine-protein kinase Etk/Wzc|uniref:Tyrosine-protein kinase n=1 Tax=Phytobacter diazotrophicus TaxID=395631 RepID=A0ABM7VT04_9ENTR|nr:MULTISPECIES: tyrosine-protein kinase Wzc [Phytobacter]AUU91880.1 tyrosine-protein kinase Wzc [Enterobacteriaceae bacterium ENNIH3]AUV08073.1 tyrosine-protein kinase Wzc [Enterobacteriaceae bacterium ENNIH2]MBS6738371.1 tyrosine-protein kinase Wzc [Enterobacteriaceae bacterium]PTA94209.1 tyrosine-protein kinase Wzc [Kluyvera sp. Nf5]PWF49698.1 tyrosine-protein kinase Wzc [[Kluyvera] intestini]PXW62410.1 tyrosine-protein kinase Etk/Wzc [Grimontella sp. AG753]